MSEYPAANEIILFKQGAMPKTNRHDYSRLWWGDQIEGTLEIIVVLTDIVL